jgi:hypothetical protein
VPFARYRLGKIAGAAGAARSAWAATMNGKPDWSVVHRIRYGHVQKLLNDRYCGEWQRCCELPDDDAGAEDLQVLLRVKAMAYPPVYREKVLLKEIGLRAPWLSVERAREVVAEVTTNPIKVTSAWLGQALCVDSSTRDRLAIWQIGATDLDAAATKERQRQRRRERERDRKRKQRKRQPRAEYLADVKKNSERSTKPWLAMGISRATYYRRQSKKDETTCVHKTNGKVRPKMRPRVSA